MKWVIILIIAVGAAFGIPSIRARIAPPLEPVLTRLGPIGKAIQTPAKRFNAKNEADVIVRKVADWKLQNRPMPTERGFTKWIQQNMRGLERDGMDPWGNPYYLVRADKHISVGSSAQDGVPHTDDDIRASAPTR
jgi:hypothetical protein